MTAPTLEGIDQARSAVEAHMSPRFRELDRLDRYVCGTQYQGRPNWWTAVDVPLAEREPCVVYPIAKIAISSFVDLVLGQHRFPSIKAKGAAPTKLRKVFRQSRFASTAREQFASGLGCGTSVLIAGQRNGRPFLDTVPAKWCTPTFEPGTNVVTKLEISYPFIAQEKDAQGKWKAVPKLFRRVIDATSDTTFKTVVAQVGGGEPNWTPDPARTVQHDLGYCPVVWWACMRGATIEGRIDGYAIHGDILDEITAHDLALSQRQRAAFMAGDPQWTEIGVEPGYNPSSAGRTMATPATPSGGSAAGARASYVAIGGQPARKKGPGNIWQYEDPETKVELHQLDAGALDGIDKNARDLRLKLCDAMAFVPLDPETLPKGAITGKALESLKERQLARCDYFRDDIEDGWLIPAMRMLLRVTGIAADIEAEDLDLTWPDYYKPDYEDRQKELTAEVDGTSKTIAAIQSPAFKKAAQKRLARLLLADDVSDEDIEAIDEEIDAGAEDVKQSIDGAEAIGGLDIPSPTLHKHVKVKAAMKLAADADDATKEQIKNEIHSGVVSVAGKTAAAPATPDDVSGPSVAAAESPIPTTNGTPTIEPDAHLRAESNAGVAETVYKLLEQDYPKDTIQWIRSADVEGPKLVPLDQIDFSNREQWNATHEQDRVDEFVQKIANGEMKPIVLVNEPNDDKLMILDGHHRGLAYEKLGQPAMAYVIHTGAVGGPWDAMHSSQKSTNGLLTSQQKGA